MKSAVNPVFHSLFLLFNVILGKFLRKLNSRKYHDFTFSLKINMLKKLQKRKLEKIL